MKMDDYQVLAARTMRRGMTDLDYTFHSLFGLVSEVGEIHGLYQKIYQGHEFDRQHLIKEIGDVLWFIAELCTSLHINLDDVAKQNIDKLKARYPNGFETEKSLNRKAGDL